MYTFTTLARSGKGSSPVPAPSPLGSYTDRPTANPLDASPVYLAPMDGAFEYQPCADNAAATCTQQMAPQPPVYWYSRVGFPYAVVGDPSWQNYTVSADVLFTQAGSSAGVLDRFSDQGGGHQQLPRLHPQARRRRLVAAAQEQQIRRRERPRLGRLDRARPAWTPGTTCRSPSSGATLTAAIDGRQVATVTDNDPNYTTGIAGIEAGAVDANGAWTGTSWPIVQYRRLTVS